MLVGSQQSTESSPTLCLSTLNDASCVAWIQCTETDKQTKPGAVHSLNQTVASQLSCDEIIVENGEMITETLTGLSGSLCWLPSCSAICSKSYHNVPSNESEIPSSEKDTSNPVMSEALEVVPVFEEQSECRGFFRSPTISYYVQLVKDFIDAQDSQITSRVPSVDSEILLNSTDFLDFVLQFGNHLQTSSVDLLIERYSSHQVLQLKDSGQLTQETEASVLISGDCNSDVSTGIVKYQSTNSEQSAEDQACEFPLDNFLSISSQYPPIVLIPGGGIFYFWKAGFAMYLSKHFDLSRCIFMGTSAGALASIVALASDNMAKASRFAIKLAMGKNVWEKTGFLAGVLHELVATWLERVVPTDVDIESLRRRLLIIAYRISRVRSECFCRFQSRKDLIECLLASVHIPFYANGKLSVKARGMRYLDGSFGPDIQKAFVGEMVPPDRILLVRCDDDDYITPIPRKECIRKRSPAALLDLFRRGFVFAENLHRQRLLGPLMELETSPPGLFSVDGDPHLDSTRLDDDSLDC